ncbi:hypothetical protein LZ32DRAFT_254731 [Colletotrichum eremochloae]|nr:hypothetical protein LZ32DRAFT_254731 [Colletotrichum eremochloae]
MNSTTEICPRLPAASIKPSQTSIPSHGGHGAETILSPVNEYYGGDDPLICKFANLHPPFLLVFFWPSLLPPRVRYYRCRRCRCRRRCGSCVFKSSIHLPVNHLPTPFPARRPCHTVDRSPAAVATTAANPSSPQRLRSAAHAAPRPGIRPANGPKTRRVLIIKNEPPTTLPRARHCLPNHPRSCSLH